MFILDVYHFSQFFFLECIISPNLPPWNQKKKKRVVGALLLVIPKTSNCRREKNKNTPIPTSQLFLFPTTNDWSSINGISHYYFRRRCSSSLSSSSFFLYLSSFSLLFIVFFFSQMSPIISSRISSLSSTGFPSIITFLPFFYLICFLICHCCVFNGREKFRLMWPRRGLARNATLRILSNWRMLGKILKSFLRPRFVILLWWYFLYSLIWLIFSCSLFLMFTMILSFRLYTYTLIASDWYFFHSWIVRYPWIGFNELSVSSVHN